MAAPEIRLSVGLDLEFFRGQMRKAVTIAQSEFTAQLAVKIDRSKLDTELNNLQRSLNRRSYRIELKSNFKAEAEFAERIAATVPALEKAAAAFSQLRKGTGGGGAAASTAIKEQLSLQARLARELARQPGKKGGYSAAAISRMYDDASRKGLAGITKNATNRTERSKELSVAFASAGKNAANSFIDAFQADINKGAAAGEELGKATYEGLKRQMQIASPSKKMKKLGEESSEGFVIGLNEGLDDIEKYAQKVKSILDGVARSIATTGKTIGNVQGKRLGLGNIPLMSRSLEGRSERSAAAIGGVSSLSTLRALQPGINKTITSLAQLRAQVDQNTSKLSGFGLIIGLAAFAGVPLAKSIVKLTGSANNFATLLDRIGLELESAGLKAASNILSASSSRLLSGGGLAGLLPPAYRGINPAAGPAGLLGSGAGPAGLLPPAYRGIGPGRNAGALPPAYRGIGAAPDVKALPPAYRGLPFGFDFNALPPSKGGKLALNNNAMASRINPILDKGFIDSFIKSTNDAIKTVQARIRTAGVEAFKLEREVLPIRPPGRETRLLTAGVGRTPSPYATGEIGGESRQAMTARRTAEAYARSAFRGMTATDHFTQRRRLPGTVFAGDEFTSGGGRDRVRGAGQPPEKGGALAIQTTGPRTALDPNYYKNATKYAEALKIADASSRNFSASQIPLIGGIKGLAGEFGEATKQVLLYGTAYKGLAFFIGLPGRVLDATKNQQQFNNGLKVATQDTGAFGKELLYVDNVQRAFGLNLETTRTGFTRLYASMAPTGFDSGSIEKLFTGISAATAALQLTPDKAERVIYAFGQMASKGQIMSEELKGQLGDVLPGALAIFSKAAGMSVKDFSKAMEDGVFVGGRFREVFAKVSDELMNRFGTGAQAAGKSLQGLINVVGSDFTRTLESFAPLANAAAQATLGPLSGMLKQVSMAAQLAMGEQERVKKQLEDSQKDVSALKTGGANAREIKAAEQNVAALAAKYELLNNAAKDPAIAQQVQNIQNFTEQIGKAGTFTMNLAGAIGGALAPILSLLGSNLTTVISLVTSFYIGFQAARLAAMALMGALLAYRTISAILGFGPATLGANALASAFGVIGVAATGATVQVTGLKFALAALVASTVVGAIVGGLMLIAGAFATTGNKAKEAADKAKQSMDSMRDAAIQGNTSLVTMGSATANQNIKDLKELQRNILAGKTEMNKFKNSITEIVTPTQAQKQLANLFDITLPAKASKEAIQQLFQAAIRGQQSVKAQAAILLPVAKKREAAIGLNQPMPDPAATGADEPGKPESLETYYSLQDQLAKAASAADIARIQDEFEERFRLANSYYDLQEARANSFQKITINFQKELLAIEQRRQKAMLDAELDVRKARESVASEAAVGGGMASTTGGSSIGGVTGLKQGMTGTASGPHFHIKKTDGSYIGEAEARAIFDPLVRQTLSMTSGYGPRNTGIPGASTYHRGIDLAGPANTPLNLAPGYSMTGASDKGGLGYAAAIRGPSGQGYEIGHNQRPSAGAGAPRQVPGSERRQTLATQQTGFALNDQRVVNLRAEKRATEETAIAIENYVAAIAPVAEQQLQNSILEKRISLMKSGLSGNLLDTEIQIFEQEEKQRVGVSDLNKMIEENNQRVKDGTMGKQDAIDRNKDLLDTINKLNIAVPLSTKLTKENAMAQANSAFTERVNALKEEIRLLLISNDAERRLAELRKDYNEDEIQAQKVFDLEKIKKNIEETRALIGDFVSSTTGDYKGFLKAVISGEDAADALKQFQDGLKDKVLTIFLDFAMAPVEKFLKEGLEGLLLPKAVKQKAGEIPKEIAKDPVEATNRNTDSTDRNTPALDSLTATIAAASSTAGGAGTNPEEKTKDELDKMAKDTGKAANDAKDNGEKFKESLGKVTAGIGIAAGTIMGIMAGMSQIKKGGTGNTLMGIGSILASVGGGIGGFMKLKGANGGTAAGGWKPFPARAFANGGMVKGPTLGLVGEGKYNEAIVPLPDGRSIPVQMRGGPGGGGSSRDLLASQSQSRSSPSVLSMSFQSTTINGVEYVDRAQLEMAMAETRRVASRDGAARGANLAIDRLANSPSSRRRAGIR